MVDLGHVAYEPFAGLPIELLYYVLGMLDLVTVHKLRLLSKSFYVVCTDTFLRRKLYRRTLEDFELVCKDCDMDNNWGRWLPLYQAAREAWSFFTEKPNLLPVLGNIPSHACAYVPVMFDTRMLYDEQQMDAITQWVPKMEEMRWSVRNAIDFCQRRLKLWKAQLSTKRAILRRSTRQETQERLGSEIQALETKVAPLQSVADCLEKDHIRLVDIRTKTGRMLLSFPETWIKDRTSVSPDDHMRLLQAFFVERLNGAYNHVMFCQAIAVYEAMQGNNQHIAAVIRDGHLCNFQRFCDVLAVIDDTDVMDAIGTRAFQSNDRLSILQKAVSARSCPNLAKWIFNSFGEFTEQYLDTLNVDEVLKVYADMDRYQRYEFCTRLIEWDKPLLFQTLFDVDAGFRLVVAQCSFDRKTFLKVCDWNVMPCLFYVLCACMPNSEHPVSVDTWRQAFQRVFDDSGKTWDDVYTTVVDMDTETHCTSSKRCAVYTLSEGKLSDDNVIKYSTFVATTPNPDLPKALKIASTLESFEPLCLFVTSTLDTDELTRALRSVHPRNYRHLMNIALEYRKVKCINALFNMSYVPTEEQEATVSSLDGRKADQIRKLFTDAKNRFVI
jgi:hypothetical protein